MIKLNCLIGFKDKFIKWDIKENEEKFFFKKDFNRYLKGSFEFKKIFRRRKNIFVNEKSIGLISAGLAEVEVKKIQKNSGV